MAVVMIDDSQFGGSKLIPIQWKSQIYGPLKHHLGAPHGWWAQSDDSMMLWGWKPPQPAGCR